MMNEIIVKVKEQINSFKKENKGYSNKYTSEEIENNEKVINEVLANNVKNISKERNAKEKSILQDELKLAKSIIRYKNKIEKYFYKFGILLSSEVYNNLKEESSKLFKFLEYEYYTSNKNKDQFVYEVTKITKILDDIQNSISYYNLYLANFNKYNCDIDKMKQELYNEKRKYEKIIEEYNENLEQLNVKKNEVLDEDGIETNYSTYIKPHIDKSKLFIVKASKGGNSLIVYRYISADKKFEKAKESDIVYNALILTDTYGYIDPADKLIISVCSPAKENKVNYIGRISSQYLYFDTFGDDELSAWFNTCIRKEGDINPSGEDLNKVAKMYGNVPRQIHYHFRDEFLGGNYWNYYQQLILSVVGTTGFIQFINDYSKKENLSTKPLSNIILKYKMMINKEGRIEPKEELEFVSNQISLYVTSIIQLPDNKDEYTKIFDYYNQTDLGNEYIKKMLIKQIFAYKISTNEIEINTTNKHFLNIQIPYSIYYTPVESTRPIKYIMNNSSTEFDYLVNNIFVKIVGDESEDVGEIVKGIVNDKEYYKQIKVIEYVILYTSYLNEGHLSLNPFELNSENENEMDDENNNVQIGTISQNENNLPEIILPYGMVLKVMRKNYPFSASITSFDVYSETIGCFNYNNQLYLFRSCYKRIIHKLEEHNRNYIIYGIKGSGKRVLSELLYYYYVLQRKYNVLLIMKNKDNERLIKYSYTKKDTIVSILSDKPIIPERPYIVISYNEPLGEDSYSDAEKIIILYNTTDQSIKTFQSKRCPAILYLSPFDNEEVEKYVSLRIDSNIPEEIEKIKRYGNIPAILNISEKDIIDGIKSEVANNLVFIEEMINGIEKSPLSKQYPSNIFIYHTIPDDVSKSNKLVFISKYVKDLVIKDYIMIKTENNIDKMISLYKSNQRKRLGGNLYEAIITQLAKKNNKLIKYLQSQLEYNVGWESITYKDFSNNDNMPDLDGLLDYYGLQYIVADTHKVLPHIIIFLHNLKCLFTRNEKNMIKSIDDYMKNNLDFNFVIMSNNADVNVVKREVKEFNKFPSEIQDYIPSESFFNNTVICDAIIDEVKKKKKIVLMSYNEFILWKLI